MRLDKFLCEMNIGTRSQVKNLLRLGQVTVNGTPAKKGEQQIDEASDTVCFQGKLLRYEPFVYYMLNKPRDTVSATRDNLSATVTELLEKEGRSDLFPVGRLDKDTTGLLLLTNDGELAHRLLSPKKHVSKTYLVTLEQPLSREAVLRLETGVDIGEKRPTLPAKAVPVSGQQLLLTIHEGKFHQVKRMLQAVDNRVLALERTAFGGLTMDASLAPGEYRPLTPEEISVLKSASES